MAFTKNVKLVVDPFQTLKTKLETRLFEVKILK